MRSKIISLEDVRAKFLLVGFLNTIIGFSIFFFMYHLLIEKLPYLVVLLISQIIAVMFSYSTQRSLVWKSVGPYLPEFFRFSGSYVAIGITNLVLLRIAVENMNFSILKSQFLIGILLTITNYVIQKNFVFRSR